MTNDPKDRHVLAAAVRAKRRGHRTFNTSDFPDHALKDYEVIAVHPDQFLLDQLDPYPGVTLAVLHRQIAGYRHEPTTLPGLLVTAEDTGAPPVVRHYYLASRVAALLATRGHVANSGHRGRSTVLAAAPLAGLVANHTAQVRDRP